jgi:starch phosphorylase
MKASVSGLGGFVSADRMLRDYIEGLYEPAAKQGREIAGEGFARARALAQWKSHVRETWNDVSILNVQGDISAGDVGEERAVTATVHLGRISAEDVSVQLAHGTVGSGGELSAPHLVEMQAQALQNGTCSYTGSFAAATPGLYGFTVRVLPAHPDLIGRQDLGLVQWSPG